MSCHLFSPFQTRGLTLKNRIVMSPMCQYSAVDGLTNNWHLVHYGSRAVGGVGSIIIEATAVAPEGRISTADVGLWNEAQAKALAQVARCIRDNGAAAGIQLAHAGRKAGHSPPWQGGKPLIGPEAWQVLAPSEIPFSENSPKPRALTESEIDNVVEQFVRSTKLSVEAGFEIIEIHMAHGYLLHEFLSPLTNTRKDQFGGTLENRMRLPLTIVEKVRAVMPESLPLWVRVSATDWSQGGWDVEQTVQFAKNLLARGVDLIDCSSGGLLPNVQIPMGPGYQVSLARDVRNQARIATGAVGLITEAKQAESVLKEGSADLIFLGRELLRNPYWALQAAADFGINTLYPRQYERARV